MFFLETGKRSHRLGKFNILSVNVILFQGNQKNIRVGLLGPNNADFWFVYKKIRAISGLSWRLNFSSRTDVFLQSQLFSKSTFNLAFLISKNFAFGLMAGKFGKFGLKALFVSCTFIVRVTEAPADHESTRRSISKYLKP